MFGRQLPSWFGRQGMAPPVDPSMMAMLPQGQGQPQQPQFTQTQAAQAPQQAVPVGPDPRADAMRQRQYADMMQNSGVSLQNVNSPLTAGIYALTKGIEGYTTRSAKEAEDNLAKSDRKALIDALNQADPMSALATLDNPEAQNAFIQMKLGQMNQKPAATWQDVDTDGDGSPDAQRNSMTQEYKPIDRQLSFAQREQLARAGASRTSVNVGGGGTDKQVYESVEKSFEKAAPAVGGLGALKEAEKALEGPGVYGQFADERLMLQKVGALFGADPTAITNTETFRSSVAPNVAAIMKATVGSTQISNADREFAEKAAGGSIKLDKGTIKRMLSITRRASEGLIERHKKTLDTVYPNTPDGKFARERALFEIQAPPAYAPQNAKERKPNTVYDTPKGPMRWTGTGWVPAQ